MFERIPNKYVLHENHAVGTTGTGAEYIIDIDDYYKSKILLVTVNETESIFIRVNKLFR